MNKKEEIVQKCIRELKQEGINAKLVPIYGAAKSEAIITLPGYKINNEEKEEV